MNRVTTKERGRRSLSMTNRGSVSRADRGSLPIEVSSDSPLVAGKSNLPGMADVSGRVLAGMDDVDLVGPGLGQTDRETPPTTLPAVIQTALSKTRQGVKAYQMANVVRQWPAPQRAKLERAGRELFSQQSGHTVTLGEVFTVNSLTNSTTEVKKMLAWVCKHCSPKQRDVQYSFPSAPGYRPKAEVWDGDGVRFLLVRETPKDFGGDIDPMKDANEQNLFYVYGWTEPDASVKKVPWENRKAIAEASKDPVNWDLLLSAMKVYEDCLAEYGATEAIDWATSFVDGIDEEAEADEKLPADEVAATKASLLDAVAKGKTLKDLETDAVKARPIRESAIAFSAACHEVIVSGKRIREGGRDDVLRAVDKAVDEYLEELGEIGEGFELYNALDFIDSVVYKYNLTSAEVWQAKETVKKRLKETMSRARVREGRKDLRDEVLDAIDAATESYYDDLEVISHDEAVENSIEFIDAVAEEFELTPDEVVKAKEAVWARLTEAASRRGNRLTESGDPRTFVCVGEGRVEIIEGAEAMSADALEGNKFIVNPGYRGGEDEYRFYGKLDIGRNTFRVDPGLSGKTRLEANVDFGKVVYAVRKATIDAEPNGFWATWKEA